MKMLEDTSDKEKYGLVGIFVVSILMAFGAGALSSSNGSPTGAFAGEAEMSENQIEERVQTLIDRQAEQQRQQLRAVANQSENLTMDDLSINSEIESVSRSDIGSLYRVDISMTGEVPNQLEGGTQSLDQSQVLYISSDGRYLFQEPTDLEQPQQTQQQSQPQQQPQAPTGGQ